MYDEILDFWFEQLEPKQWFSKDLDLDLTIKQRFGHIHVKAAAGELSEWRNTAEGSLAEIIVLDQFSRNIYRNLPESFAFDPLALALSQFMIAQKSDLTLSKQQRTFVYLPYMHSESLIIHEQAMALFTELGNENNLSFERQHKAIIDRFGRYPHRNKILGRESSAEELVFLSQPNSGF